MAIETDSSRSKPPAADPPSQPIDQLRCGGLGGTPMEDPNYNPDMDIDHDGDVKDADYAIAGAQIVW